MRTKSIWGAAPSRLYRFKSLVYKKFGSEASVCIIGACDGKFAMPFLRDGFSVTAYELDPAAIYGGLKEFPKARDHIAVQKYVCNPDRNPIYQKLESEKREILGLVKRAEIEGVKDYLTVIEENYYKNPPKQKYDAIFSSCSFQYSCNFDMRIEEIVSVIQNSVAGRGYVYLDYMMPLEECHSWRPEHYLRKGEMQNSSPKMIGRSSIYMK